VGKQLFSNRPATLRVRPHPVNNSQNSASGADCLVETLIPERVIAKLSSFFGALTLLWAAVGLYGTMSYTVVRRTNEIGIRMAIGARQGDVTWMVLREVVTLVAIGLAVGIPAALVAGRMVEGYLFGLKPNDPARRAARVDPNVGVASGVTTARD
jgi:ABC-type antimicrobial peptide transport system permease subunit